MSIQTYFVKVQARAMHSLDHFSKKLSNLQKVIIHLQLEKNNYGKAESKDKEHFTARYKFPNQTNLSYMNYLQHHQTIQLMIISSLANTLTILFLLFPITYLQFHPSCSS